MYNNIYWEDIPDNARVERSRYAYISCGAVVFWHGHESREAQEALDKRVRLTAQEDVVRNANEESYQEKLPPWARGPG